MVSLGSWNRCTITNKLVRLVLVYWIKVATESDSVPDSKAFNESIAFNNAIRIRGTNSYRIRHPIDRCAPIGPIQLASKMRIGSDQSHRARIEFHLNAFNNAIRIRNQFVPESTYSDSLRPRGVSRPSRAGSDRPRNDRSSRFKTDTIELRLLDDWIGDWWSWLKTMIDLRSSSLFLITWEP